MFLKIQKAWQVLSDAELRVVYDNDLRSSRHDRTTTADEISIDDMSVEITGEDMDIFLSEEIGCFCGVCVLPCGSCSLKTRVWVDSDMKIPFQN
ncbi:hypothetical protein N665_0310s0011 [Sinapis alba]|nr:hypothetical protein N665_0310s0011 [Sinapis alba]